ncbi:hypothetical protein FOPE_10043 [Fonsecaea pedrosoi]|nr:hypothetical protein FOPE_10043 [Fonsecaea pedrosoi]
MCPQSSYWQFCIPPPARDLLQYHLDIWPNNGDIAGKRCDGCKEVAKEDEDAVEFNQESSQWPPNQYEKYAGHERSGAFEFLTSGEEDKRLLDADDKGQADEEEDLGVQVSVQ